MQLVKKINVALLVGSFALITSVAPSAIAADYPPVQVSFEEGVEIFTAVKPLAGCRSAIVPVATSNVLPVVVSNQVSINHISLKSKALTDKSVQDPSVRLTTSLIMGGIVATEKTPVATAPIATVCEIQIPVDVPSRITLTGYKASSAGTASFVNHAGKVYPLGTFKTSASGKITTPALSFNAPKAHYKLVISAGGKTATFRIRSVG